MIRPTNTVGEVSPAISNTSTRVISPGGGADANPTDLVSIEKPAGGVKGDARLSSSKRSSRTRSGSPQAKSTTKTSAANGPEPSAFDKAKDAFLSSVTELQKHSSVDKAVVKNAMAVTQKMDKLSSTQKLFVMAQGLGGYAVDELDSMLKSAPDLATARAQEARWSALSKVATAAHEMVKASPLSHSRGPAVADFNSGMPGGNLPASTTSDAPTTPIGTAAAAALNPVGDSPSLADQLTQLRADTNALAGKTSDLVSQFGSIQQTAYNSYNQSHALYEDATGASVYDPATSAAPAGTAMNGDLPVLVANQGTLQTANTNSVSALGFCQSEVARLGDQLTALAASAPTGPVATALLQALSLLNEGRKEQSQVKFDGTDALSQTTGIIGSVTAEAGTIAGATAGVDVSSTANQAMSDLTNAQKTYEQLASKAEKSGMRESHVSQSCSQAVSQLDQALAQLAGPGPAPGPTPGPGPAPGPTPGPTPGPGPTPPVGPTQAEVDDYNNAMKIYKQIIADRQKHLADMLKMQQDTQAYILADITSINSGWATVWSNSIAAFNRYLGYDGVGKDW